MFQPFIHERTIWTQDCKREAVQKKPEEESSKGKTGPRTDTTRVAKERDKWRGEARLS